MKKAEERQEVSYSLNPKPTYYIYIILCGVVILFFIILICLMFNKTATRLTDDEISINTGNMFGTGRKNCNLDKVYCFTDNDCTQQCTATTVGCNKGICTNDIKTFEAENKCDPSKGVIGYFVGNTALGFYEYICKSVDPAIAISVDENRMCFGDKSYLLDYLTSYPSIYTCTCPNQVTIAATSQKRKHVECSDKYIDLVPQ